MTTLVCGTYCAGAHLAKPMLRALPPVVHFPAAQVQGNPAFSALFQLLQDELEQSQQNSDALLHHLFDALFLYVLREWANKAASKPVGWLPGLHDTALATALARMHAEPGAPWTVQSLAHAAHLSRAAFARRFTEQVGEPPLTYLTRWRMEMAARLLRDTAAPLAEVARHVGYDSEFTFSRAFKRHQGQAPTAFRRTRHQSHRPAGTA